MAKPQTSKHTTPAGAVDRLEELYAKAASALAAALDRYLDTRVPPSPETRAKFHYPVLRVIYRSEKHHARPRCAPSPSCSGRGSMRRQSHIRALSAAIFLSSLEPLVSEYGAEIETGVSAQEIPYPYVIERAEEITSANVSASELARHFPTPTAFRRRRRSCRRLWQRKEGEPYPLALFDAVRTDFSCAG